MEVLGIEVAAHEQALLDYLTEHFNGLWLSQVAREPSINILVKVLAGVFVCEMHLRGIGEEDITQVVGTYARLLGAWTREGWRGYAERASRL
jgi:hypothetical protein